MGRSKLWRRQDGAVNMPAHSVPARGRSGALAFSSCSSLVAAFRARLKELLQLATCFAGSSHLWPMNTHAHARISRGQSADARFSYCGQMRTSGPTRRPAAS